MILMILTVRLIQNSSVSQQRNELKGAAMFCGCLELHLIKSDQKLASSAQSSLGHFTHVCACCVFTHLSALLHTPLCAPTGLKVFQVTETCKIGSLSYKHKCVLWLLRCFPAESTRPLMTCWVLAKHPSSVFHIDCVSYCLQTE